MIIKFLIILASIIFSGCVAFPKYEKGMNQSCYDWKLCQYYNAVGKNKSNCGLERAACEKYRIYENCKNKEFRWKDQTCQSCWDKLR